ncbi:MAG: AtpZ/AtpI family protein [Candidatus Krumholzibacteriia bacterium]
MRPHDDDVGRCWARGCAITPAPRDFLRYSHLGVQFVIIIIAFAMGGAWLDKHLSAGNLVTLAGIFAGAAIGFYIMYREIPKK